MGTVVGAGAVGGPAGGGGGAASTAVFSGLDPVNSNTWDSGLNWGVPGPTGGVIPFPVPGSYPVLISGFTVLCPGANTSGCTSITLRGSTLSISAPIFTTGNVAAYSSTLTVSGTPSIGDVALWTGSTLNVSGTLTGDVFGIGTNATVNITGQVTGVVVAFCAVNVTGGTVTIGAGVDGASGVLTLDGATVGAAKSGGGFRNIGGASLIVTASGATVTLDLTVYLDCSAAIRGPLSVGRDLVISPGAAMTISVGPGLGDTTAVVTVSRNLDILGDLLSLPTLGVAYAGGAGQSQEFYTLISFPLGGLVHPYTSSNRWPTASFDGNNYHMRPNPPPVNNVSHYTSIVINVNIGDQSPTYTITALEAQTGAFILSTGWFVWKVTQGGVLTQIATGATVILDSGALLTTDASAGGGGAVYVKGNAQSGDTDSFACVVNDTTDRAAAGEAVINVTINIT